MFSDVLVALRRAQRVDQVLVVSRDHNAQRIAGGYGAMVADDEDSGHTDAALRGIAVALELGYERVLIVPDRHGTGTNALLLQPPDVMKPSFGPGSHDRHHRHAAAAGITAQTIEVP